MKTRLRQSLSSLKSRLISRDLQDIYLFKGDLAKQPSGHVPLDIIYQIHNGTDVLELIDQINPLNDQGRRFALDRLRAGDKAVIGSDNGSPVFYGWLMFGTIEMTYGVFMPVPQGMAFGYNLFTKSSHRRRGLMTGFYEFSRNYLKQKEFHTLYVGISTRNNASIKAHLKNGFEKIGYFYTIKLLAMRFTLARFEHAKRFHIN